MGKLSEKTSKKFPHYGDQLNRRYVWFMIFDSYNVMKTPFIDHIIRFKTRNYKTYRNWVTLLLLYERFITKFEHNNSCSTIYGRRRACNQSIPKISLKSDILSSTKSTQVTLLCKHIGQILKFLLGKTESPTRVITEKWFNQYIG